MESLKECEDALVQRLSKTGAVLFSKELFRCSILPDTERDLYNSLDQRGINGDLQIRYLLRLVFAWAKEDGSVRENFLRILVGMDKNLNSLVEVLVCVSPQWEALGIALGLSRKELNNCKNEDLKVSLFNVLQLWTKSVSILPGTAVMKLKQALSSELVGHGRVTLNLEKRFTAEVLQSTQVRVKPLPVSHSLTISDQSTEATVSDGKSTLLFVQASPRESISYQWKKDGQTLSNNKTYSGVHEDILVIKNVSQGTEGKYTCSVSNQEMEKCSNKIILMVVYSPYKKRLLNLYSVQSEVPQDSWPPVDTKTYIKLDLRQSNTSNLGTVKGIIAEKKEVNYDQVFGAYCSEKLVVIEGCPGSGKTTLVKKIIKDWTKGITLVRARLVFMITFQNFNSGSKEVTLSNMLRWFYPDENKLEDVTTSIKEDDGEGVCFIIDGLDEYQPQEKSESIIFRLIHKTYLPKSMVIVSSRSAALRNLIKNMAVTVVEVMGFCKQQVYEYIENFPFSSNNTDLPDKLKKYLHLHRNILKLCSLPLLTAMICFLYQLEEGQIPCTQTKIYEEFIRCTILRCLRLHDDEVQLHSLGDLDENTEKKFKMLCQLAYKMTLEPELIIKERLDNEACLGLFSINHIALTSGFSTMHTFLHMTFQEFLAAYYIASLEEDEQMEIVSGYSSKMSSAVWGFYCGLTDFESDKGFDKLNGILRGQHDALELLRYAFESQQHIVCDEVVKRLDSVFDFDSYSLTSTFDNLKSPVWPLVCPGCSQFVHSDLSVVDYVMSTTSQTVKRICLPPGKVTVSFLKHIYSKNWYQLEVLIVKEPLDTSETRYLAAVLEFCTSLRVADLNFDRIGPEGAAYVLDGLKSLTNIQKLTLSCTSSSQGIQVLLNGLQHLKNAEILLAFEHLDIDGVAEVASGLQGLCNLNIFFLELSECLISSKIAKKLACGLNNLTKLRVLNVSRNNICSECASIIVAAIQPHRNLHHLNLSHNSIGPDGANKLASAIKCLTNLSYLNISYNNINSEYAVSLSNGLTYLTSLKELHLSNNNLDLTGAKAVIEALKNCQNLNKVHIGFDRISEKNDPVDADCLVTAIQHGMVHRELRLDNQNIGVQPLPNTKCSFAVLGCLFILFILVIFLLLGQYSKGGYHQPYSLRDL